MLEMTQEPRVDKGIAAREEIHLLSVFQRKMGRVCRGCREMDGPRWPGFLPFGGNTTFESLNEG